MTPVVLRSLAAQHHPEMVQVSDEQGPPLIRRPFARPTELPPLPSRGPTCELKARRWRTQATRVEHMFAETPSRRVNPAEGAAPDLVWPQSLVTRPPAPLVVFLDLNHWIGLSKAVAGHTDGLQHQGVLEACRQAHQDGRAIFPLADATYVEVSKIQDPRQRQDLAVVMEELSGFTCLLSKPTIMQLELDIALASLLEDATVLQALPLLGYGVFWAFGRVGLRIREGDQDVTDRFCNQHPELFADIQRKAEWSFLAGPTDEEVPALQAHGWQPDAGIRIAEQRAQEEREQVGRFNDHEGGRWRRGRIRDVILGREIFIELHRMLEEALLARGRAFDELTFDRDQARRLVRSMPTGEVATELKVAAHRNPQTKWTSNDIIDIDAMSLAVPYCDIVVTEKRACHVLRAAHLDGRMDTKLVHRLSELPALL